MLAPAHFAYVDQALYAGSDLYKRAIVGHYYYFAFHMVANFQVGAQRVPWMGHQLLQTKGNALLLVVEVEDNHIEFLVQLYHFFRVAHTAPAQVGDMDKSVYAAQVDEHTVGSDVLDSAFEHLAFFEFGDDFFLLLFEFGLDESLVAYYDVAVFLVDFNNLEFHSLVHIHVVVADGAYVNLAAGQECLDAEYVYYHTALCAALDIALDDFVVLQRLVHALPAA